MDKLIRNVDEVTWKKFKVAAARHQMRLGKFLEKLMQEHQTFHKSWARILSGKKTLTDEEAEAMHGAIQEFEEVYEFE